MEQFPGYLGKTANERLDVNPTRWFSKWLKDHVQTVLENEFRMPWRVVSSGVTGSDSSITLMMN